MIKSNPELPGQGDTQNADVDVAAEEGILRRYDFAENPCQTGTDEECAEWLRERLYAFYND